VFNILEPLSASRRQELNNYSGVMTRWICDAGGQLVERSGGGGPFFPNR
jgi:hypothetical protein